jgi:hypothetical protein
MGARAGRALRQQNSYAFLRIPKNLHGRQNPTIMKKILLGTLTSFRASLRNPTTYGSSPRGLLLIPLILVWFALCQSVQSAMDTPDPGPLPATNTGDGQGALQSLTTGIYNSAFGIFSLLSLTDGNFCTGVGAGTLLLNTASENTATGAGALFSETTGVNNTAVGAFALFSNVDGNNNTAVGDRAMLTGNASGATAIGFSALQADNGGSNTAAGFQALVVNDTGFNNAAFGVRALESNTTGVNNTAVGNLALDLSNGSDNVALGRHAGDGLTTANNNIVIGHGSGISTTNGQVDDSCYIGNIVGAGVDAGTAEIVFVDQDGKLGTTALPNTGALPGVQPQAVPQKPMLQAVPDAKQAKINLKVEKLQAMVAQQKKEIEVLTAQLKEQASQIQRVSAQLEVKKPAPKVVRYEQ